MKATILFSSLAVIIGSLLYINKPLNATNTSPTPVSTGPVASTGSYSTSITIECPVVGKFPVIEPSYEFTATDGQKYYDHCKSCDAGVFLTDKQTNIIRCTYCGKVKKQISDTKE